LGAFVVGIFVTVGSWEGTLADVGLKVTKLEVSVVGVALVAVVESR